VKALYSLGLILLILYISADAAIVSEEGEERFAVQVVAGLGVGIMFVYCVACGLRLKRITRYWAFAKWWTIFLGLIGIYCLLAQFGLPTHSAQTSPRYLLVAAYVMLTIFFFYYAVVNNHLSDRWLLVVLCFLILGGVLDLHTAITNPRYRLGMDVINTSSGYVFLMLMPILMYRFRDQAVWVFFLTLILTAIAGKRGALTVYSALLVYYVFNYRIIAKQIRLNFRAVVGAVLAIAAVMYFYEVAYESLTFRLDSIVDDRRGTIGSGRDQLWESLYYEWRSGDAGTILLGLGYFSTLTLVGLLAHNDFLQFLVDFGLLGFFLYLMIIAVAVRDVRRLRNVDRYVYLMLMVCILVLLGRGAFAGTIRTDQIYWAISFGYLLGVATKLYGLGRVRGEV